MVVGGQPYTPAALPPEKRFIAHFAGVWMGPRAGVDRYKKSRPSYGI